MGRRRLAEVRSSSRRPCTHGCSYSMKGPHRPLSEHTQRMAPWLQQWAGAADDTVDEAEPYNEGTYQFYIQWYAPRTRTRLLQVEAPPPHRAPTVSDLYSDHIGVALHQTADVGTEIQDDANQMLQRLRSGSSHEEMTSFVSRMLARGRRLVAIASCRHSTEVRNNSGTRPDGRQSRGPVPHTEPMYTTPLPPRSDQAGGSSWQGVGPTIVPTPGFRAVTFSEAPYASQSSQYGTSGDGFDGSDFSLPDVFSQFVDAPPPTQPTQETGPTQDTQPARRASTRDHRPAQRYTPSAYDVPHEPELPASARKARRLARARGGGRGRGEG
ncbi:hypothetical protein ACP4OV_013240 [Aristida adscensionis]